ncbi:MAG TPA: HD domain-containing phosphohydrolase, partial [Polyangiaceae bacterium]
REFTVPVSPRSMSGYVALHRKPLNIPDVYDLPALSPYGFDRSFDEKIHYRTKSMLCAPLLSRVGEVIGVLQLINKKRDPERKLLSDEDVDEQVIPFDDRSEELLATLASQAGIALENAILNSEIQHMLEGFVRASVEAIEQRDPTTSGHSRRVADLTVGLARAVERCDVGPYRAVSWTQDNLRELEYASLLHDFGKIGVREEVLVKAKKLYGHELENIRSRFEFAIRSIEVDVLSRKLRLLERGAKEGELAALDRELAERKAELDSAFAAILAANEPTVLKGGDFQRIEAVARERFTDLSGNVMPLLRAEEVQSLSVTRGSLTTGEIDEIRSHVVHTFEFLSQIPWGKQFRRVAIIAGAHHERLNGTGYPHRLRAEEIPLQSKLMSVSDIFDALTASDRPYKKAVPLEKALDILGFEVKDQHVDADLVKIFIESKVWTVLAAPK